MSSAVTSSCSQLPGEGWLQGGKIRRSRRHRGVCLGVDAVGYGMVSLMMSSRDKHDKLRRAMLSCLFLVQPTARAGYMVRSKRLGEGSMPPLRFGGGLRRGGGRRNEGSKGGRGGASQTLHPDEGVTKGGLRRPFSLTKGH